MTNTGNGLEGAPVSAGEDFGSLVRSALREKGLQEDEKAERFLPLIDGQWISSLLSPNPALLSGIELQAPDGSVGSAVLTAPSNILSNPVVPDAPSHPSNLVGPASTASVEASVERALSIPDQGPGPSGPDILNPPVMPDRSFASALIGMEAGADLAHPEFLNPVRALPGDSKDTDPLPKTAPSSSDPGSESGRGDRLNPLQADGRFESIAASTKRPEQGGIDLLRDGAVKDPVYGPRLQDGPSPGRTGTPAQDGVRLTDPGESTAAQENLNPLPNGGPSAFRRTEWEGAGTAVTEKAMMEKESLSPLAQKGNGPGLESFSLSGTSSHPSPGSTNGDGAKEPFPSLRAVAPEIHEQVGRQVLWSLRNNEEKIRLVLEPPELGNIYMEVKREKELVKATLWTDNSAAKEILQGHQVQLQKLLKADGFALEKFEVFIQQGSGWFQERREKAVDRGPWSRREHGEEGMSRGPASLEAASAGTGLSSRGGRYVDVFI